MRICLIARNRFHNSRKALATHRVLKTAGHDVVVVAVDSAPPRDPVVATVPRRSPHPLARMARRMGLSSSNKALLRRIASAAATTGADLYLPLHEDTLSAAVRAARRSGAAVQRTPRMPSAGEVDLIDLAPALPDLAMPVAGTGTGFTPGNTHEPYDPRAGRYRGESVVLCYRKTATNPGRYIEAALTRSGLEVRVETDAIDLGTVDPAARFVLFVESPYPAIDVTGSTPVPVLFWAHHGEHHIHPNIRLADRYRADAVLLAHSWHLAHWFPTPVHRFPFAVPPELTDPSRPLADRAFDVAMVGQNLRGDAWQYQRRRQLVETLENLLPSDRVRFVEGVTPEEMTSLYANSRLVLNEGGIRHYPITMRVFEAVGSGAVLLTDPVPGLDMIFRPGREYALLSDDVTIDVERLLGDVETTQTMADRAVEKARGHHTYDHRVDDLMRIATDTPKRPIRPTTATSELARLIDQDVEVQRVVHDGVTDLAHQLPDREVWAQSERTGRLAPQSMDAAVITSGDVVRLRELADTARRYIYASSGVTGIDEYLRGRHPEAVLETTGRFKRLDLMSESYRVNSAGRTG